MSAPEATEDDVSLRNKLVTQYMKGEDIKGSFENTKKSGQSGKKWKELMIMIANGQKKDDVLTEADKTTGDEAVKLLAEHMKDAVSEIFGSHETIKTIKMDYTTNETQKTMDQCKMRITSFFDMVKTEVGTNGFFLCQENDYTTFGLIDSFFNLVERTTMFNGLQYIHAIKLGKNSVPITSATKIDEILLNCPDDLKNLDGKKNMGKTEWGDGVTIFFGNDWKCESFKWSSGGSAQLTQGILKTSFAPPAAAPPDPGAPAPAATEIVSTDAFIIGIFNKDSTKIQIATTHLESGDTTTKGDKDIKREVTITQIIGLTNANANIPTIYGFDGNSSAYIKHTKVIDALKSNGFESAIEGHTIQKDMTYDEKSHLISSLKQRGWMTEQPWKPDPISYLIDYLVYKGGVSVENAAKVPTGSAQLMGDYALPSSWFSFNLPRPEDRNNIANWGQWASDHIAVGAMFKVGEKMFKVTTLNALAIPLTLDGFSKGSKWLTAPPPEAPAPSPPAAPPAAGASNDETLPAAAPDDTFFGNGGKRTRRKRNRKTRRRRRRSRRGRR